MGWPVVHYPLIASAGRAGRYYGPARGPPLSSARQSARRLNTALTSWSWIKRRIYFLFYWLIISTKPRYMAYSDFTQDLHDINKDISRVTQPSSSHNSFRVLLIVIYYPRSLSKTISNLGKPRMLFTGEHKGCGIGKSWLYIKHKKTGTETIINLFIESLYI